MSKSLLKIATRESPLALWQANFVSRQLRLAHPELKVELLGITTKGDKILDSPLAKIGGKGLFVKELERALFDGEADIAVHSMKDVPMELPAGLHIGVICEREDPSDAFVSNNYAMLSDLPEGARVGTSSLRRQCQVRHYRPDLDIRDLRGNVGTRLARLDANNYDAIILAAAGLLRLEMADRIRERMPHDILLPAGGQGAVGIEFRDDDAATRELLSTLHHDETAARVRAERAVVAKLQGSCQVPIGSYAEWQDGSLHLRALVGSVDGREILRSEGRAPAAEAQALGERVAEELLGQGAQRILDSLV